MVKGQYTDGVLVVLKGEDKYEEEVENKFNYLFKATAMEVSFLKTVILTN